MFITLSLLSNGASNNGSGSGNNDINTTIAGLGIASSVLWQTTVGTLQPGDLDIPVPERCLRNGTECSNYVIWLLQSLGLLSATVQTSLATEFTVFVDGGRPVDRNFSVRGVHDDSVSTSPRYPYTIRYNGRVIARPNAVRVEYPQESYNPANTVFQYDATSAAATHVYIEFRLGPISKVFDISTPENRLGGPNLSTFHSRLEGVTWRDCRRYVGITATNIEKAINAVLNMQGPARIPSTRVEANNKLHRTCPLG